ncbi:MAG: Ig-like domain-containing protein [Candidatus Poribacteria bacterium]|nr:Ig-like domain-containing protein [Candidatus Poribacteria bacterium]
MRRLASHFFRILLLCCFAGFLIHSSQAQTPQTLIRHSDEIYSVAYSPDGQKIAGGSDDGTIRIWDVSDGSLIRTLRGHTDGVESVAYSPDGTRIVSGGDDNAVRIWNADTGALLQTLREHTDEVPSVAYSPDGQKVASASSDRTIRIWDVNAGSRIRTLQRHTDGVESVAYSSDGTRIVSGGDDNTVRIWNADTGALLRTLRRHTDEVYSVAYSPDGRNVASGSDDGTIRIWDVSDGSLIRTLRGHTDGVESVAYSPDGARIVSGGGDNAVRIWNADTGALLRTLREHTDGVESVAYSPDGRNVASGSDDGTIRIWDVSDLAPLSATITGPIGDQTGLFNVTIAFSADVTGFGTSDIEVTNGSVTNLTGSGKTYTATIAPTLPGTVRVSVPANAAGNNRASNEFSVVYEPPAASPQILSEHTGTVWSVAYSPDSAALASGSDDNTIRIWNPNTGKTLRTLMEHTGSIVSVAYSPDGSRLASASADNTIMVWNPNTGDLLQTLIGHTDTVRSAAYSPDGSRLASASRDDTVRIWNPNTGDLLQTLPGHADYVRSVAYSPDGSRLASGSDDDTIRIWNPNTGDTLRTLTEHTNSVYSVAYSPDGSRLASASQDNTIRIWNLNTGKTLRTLMRHTESVLSVAYSPDGSRLASASRDDSIRIWDAQTGDHIEMLTGHTGSVTSVAYSPDGSWLASGSQDDTIRIWPRGVRIVAPSTLVTGPEGIVTGSFEAAISFSETVTGFEASDIEVTNGEAASLEGSGYNYTAVIEPAATGPVVVTVPAGAAQDADSNGNRAASYAVLALIPDTSFTLHLNAGLNMIHAPVNDPELENAADLYQKLGGSAAVGALVVQTENGEFEGYFGVGTGPALRDSAAVLVNMLSSKSATFTGGLLPPQVPLRGGVNLIGVPRSGSVSTVGDLLNMDAAVTACFIEKDGKFKHAVGSVLDEPVIGGKGYILMSSGETTLTFNGEAWKNEAAQAPSSISRRRDASSISALVASGLILQEDSLASLNGIAASVTHLRTGKTLTAATGASSEDGRFSVVFLDLFSGGFAVGDMFELRAADLAGAFGGVQSVRHTLTQSDIARGAVDFGRLLMSALPSETALLPNYPNPFNPETWIPFDLSEASRARMNIYNSAGQLVRTLNLGQLPAGAYRSRAKAAHWDGRNALGEPVASGVYYVRIEAGSFTALRRMVVLK